MLILIPLGGEGQRFKNNNYTNPKALINIFGKPIIFWLLDSLINLNKNTIIYIPYNKEYDKYRFTDLLIKNYPNLRFKFLCLNSKTDGAAETINIALKNINIPDLPILCMDSDNFYKKDIISKWNGNNIVYSFLDNNDNPIYSYIQADNNKITNIIEKEKISNYACTGTYGFSSYKKLLQYTQYIIDNNIKNKNEYYTSSVIKQMILDNIEFNYKLIDEKDYICLGTPLQLQQFYNNYPKISCLNNDKKIKHLRICFDLDNTLVTYPEINGDYTTVRPIQKNINYLNYLKSFGHTIIIYTARRMKTYNGNIGKIMNNIGKITFDTLDKYNINYDEIYFGKPYADFYIDDLAINCFNNMEKELGYYMNNISPRSFNKLESNNLETIIKKSNDLSGEIYYYLNIPNEIKDMFPIFINYKEGDIDEYTIEKINGISLSVYYVSQLLTNDLLKHIMNSIKRIQSVSINNTEKINIYSNYLAKLEKRYNSYDYSKFNESNIIFKKIYDFLKLYEDNKLGRKTVIHGDFVMTNILINNYDKIKLIDMRGEIGNVLSIYGDWLYDWGKLYQSLIGYDKILLDKELDIKYESELIKTFEEYFISLYSKIDLVNLKYITASLLFTLIPLHNNDKCYKYYDLIKLLL
jgi:capsule biosynthesis phosphatase